MIVIVRDEGAVGRLEGNDSSIGGNVWDDGWTEQGRVGSGIEQGGDAGVDVAEINVVFAGHGIGDQVGSGAEERDEAATGINGGPLAGGAGGNVAAQVTADQDGGIAEGVPTIDAGGGTGDT